MKVQRACKFPAIRNGRKTDKNGKSEIGEISTPKNRHLLSRTHSSQDQIESGFLHNGGNLSEMRNK